MANLDNLSSIISQKYSVLDNALSLVAKDNPKDKIEVEIGDTKQPDFKPQFKVMRWDNEVNLSIRATEDPEAVVETEGEIIKYKTKDYEVHQYDKPEVSEDGGFEFEWVLPKKPKSNVLTATIQTKGLNFYYQPELTQQEIDNGNIRPDNVVGSYAVYHATKGGMNDATGMEYKVGKAFHIYRPKVTDAKGNETWGVLNVDVDTGLLTITIDDKWLDEAVYPVIVDPTFGFTSAGGSNGFFSAGKAEGSYYSSGGSGTLTHINIIHRAAGTGEAVMRGAIFLKSSGSPVGYTDQISVAYTLGGDNQYSLTGGSLTITNTDYWITGWVGPTSRGNYYDTLATIGIDHTLTYHATNPPGSVGTSPTTSTDKVSIYATYTAGASTEEVFGIIGNGIIPFLQ